MVGEYRVVATGMMMVVLAGFDQASALEVLVQTIKYVNNRQED